jgi:hypothetical protein
VVETVGMFGGYFDETPAPFSDQIGMAERMRLIDANILEIHMTFTDPFLAKSPGARVPVRLKSAVARPLFIG